MDFQVFIAFVFATVLMIFTPGPSVILTIAHSISYGWRKGVLTVAGATVGIAIQLSVAAIGLSTLLNTVAVVFDWLRWIGAAYLVYLGIKQWQSAGQPLEVATASPEKTNCFAQGVVITTLNPKSLLFMATFLPQFLDPARPLGVQFAIIIPTFLLITFSVTSIWAVGAGKARELLKNQQAYKLFLQAAGVLTIVAGIGLAAVHLG